MKTERWHSAGGSRYEFDTGECNSANGFAQADTDSDAWYHGVWVNPNTRVCLSYTEGDVCRVTAGSDSEFSAYLADMLSFYGDGFRHFDCGIGSKRDEMIAGFVRLGFGQHAV